MRRLVEVTPGELETLAELLQWLVEQKAWKAVDELAQRFATQLIDDPGLLYLLAEAYAEQGEKGYAEETAARAFGLNPGKDEQHLAAHLNAADNLVANGRFDWARREFDYVIAEGNWTTTTFRRRLRAGWPRCSTTRARTSMPRKRWRSCCRDGRR